MRLSARKSGPADAFLSWIWLRFGEGLEFDNRPPKPSSWAPQLHVFPQTIAVAAGDRLGVRVKHNGKSVQAWLE